jgi:hypothetical protein
MELVVERTDAVHQCHVLGDVCEVAGVLRRALERSDEVRGYVRRSWQLVALALAGPIGACADDDDELSGDERLQDIVEVVAARTR